MSVAFDDFRTAAMEAREAAHQEGDPFVPVMQFYKGNEVLGFVMIPPFGNEAEKRRAFGVSLFMSQTFDDFDGVMMVMDAFFRTANPSEVDEDGGYSGLMPSEDPRSSEALIVTRYSRAHNDTVIIQPYSYGDDGLEWQPKLDVSDNHNAITGWVGPFVHALIDDGVTDPIDPLEYIEVVGKMGGAPAYPMEMIEELIAERIIDEATKEADDE